MKLGRVKVEGTVYQAKQIEALKKAGIHPTENMNDIELFVSKLPTNHRSIYWNYLYNEGQPDAPIWDFTKVFFGQVYDSGKDLAKTYGPALIKRIQSAFL